MPRSAYKSLEFGEGALGSLPAPVHSQARERTQARDLHPSTNLVTCTCAYRILDVLQGGGLGHTPSPLTVPGKSGAAVRVDNPKPIWRMRSRSHKETPAWRQIIIMGGEALAWRGSTRGSTRMEEEHQHGGEHHIQDQGQIIEMGLIEAL